MNEGFGGYYNQTILHPLALVVLGILSLWMVLTPRRTALLPILILSCFISPAQRLVIVGLDFTMLKIMLLVSSPPSTFWMSINSQTSYSRTI